MTTPDPAQAGGVSATSSDEIIGLHRELDRLPTALLAVRMAVNAARDTSEGMRPGGVVTDQNVQAWLAATLLVRTAFETLYHEAQDTIAVIRLMLPLPHP